MPWGFSLPPGADAAVPPARCRPGVPPLRNCFRTLCYRPDSSSLFITEATVHCADAGKMPVSTIISVCRTLLTYYHALIIYSWKRNAKLQDCPALHSQRPAAALWIFSLARTPSMWSRQHYRAPSFGTDIQGNLRNVAIPGTGIPMHLLLQGHLFVWLFLFLVYPLVALLTAVYLGYCCGENMASRFEEHLLQPSHWFARWRLNCFLVAWHAMESDGDKAVQRQYSLESKGKFLLAAEAAGIPISPFHTDVKTLFAKHVHIEGGKHPGRGMLVVAQRGGSQTNTACLMRFARNATQPSSPL